MNLKRRHRRCAVISLAGAGWLAAITTSARAATTWANAGSDWLTPANWTAGLPGAAQDALLMSGGVVVSPNISAAVSASGISIDNGGADYSLTGAGTLELGAGGLFASNGGLTTIAPALAFSASAPIDIGSGGVVNVNGPLSIPVAGTALSKSGPGVMFFNSDATAATSGLALNVDGGQVRVTKNSALGAGSKITVNGGGVFHVDTPGVPTGDVAFGDGLTQLTLNNGATLRGGGKSPAFVTSITTGIGSLSVQNGGSVTIDVPQNDDQLILKSPIRNVTEALTGTSSVIRVTGNGVLQLDAPATTARAYTGNWDIDHSIINNEAGATILNSVEALGVRSGGTPASVTLTSGFLIDVRSTSSARIPNPITFNGGYLNTSASVAGISRSGGAFFSGTLTINNVAGGSGIDMEDLFGTNNLSTTLSGQINGSGALYIYGEVGAPTVGVLSLTNTSLANPNTASGTFSVTVNSAIDASTNSLGSNPLGSATVSLSGGTLRLNHPGSASNGVISAYVANDIEVWAMDTDFGDQNGSITIGAGTASANTGNTIELGALTFNATGASANQILTVANAAAGSNYKLKFTGITTLAGNATFTSGANSADVELAAKVTGSGNLIKAGGNRLLLSSALSDYTGTTTVAAGTLIFGATHQIGALSIASGARGEVAAGADKVLAVTTLSIAGTGRLDLKDNDAVVDYSGASPLASIKSMIASAYSGGLWTGAGLTSTAAAANSGSAHATALGYGESADIFGSFPANLSGIGVDATAIIVRYTLCGDANLDGSVDTTDFNNLAANFSSVSAVWTQGDFSYDGMVDTSDFNLLASNFGEVVAAESARSSGARVPEPQAVAVGVGLLFGLRRRARYLQKTQTNR